MLLRRTRRIIGRTFSPHRLLKGGWHVPGTIIKRNDSYVVVLDRGKDPTTGKRRRKWSTFETLREAELFRATWASHPAVGAGVGVFGSTRDRVGDFLERWLRDYAKVNVKPRTYQGYDQFICTHVTPRLGHVPLAKLTPAMLQAFYAALLSEGRKATERRGAQGRGLSATTVHHIGTMLREALSHAVKWGIITQNPAELAEIPTRARPNLEVWSQEQATHFLAVARNSAKYPLLYELAMTCGLRAGELLALRWQDIDLVRGVLHVSDGKTANARRSVLLPEILAAKLRQRRGLGFVFKTKRGTPLNLNNVRFRDFAPTIMRAGVPRIRFHDLRHFNASYLLASGVDMATLSSRLGHSSKAFTLQTYAHMVPGCEEKAAAAANQLLTQTTGSARRTRR